MKGFSSILVALDLSNMDPILIREAGKMAGLFRSSKVYFVHIIPDLALPRSAQLEFRQRFAPETPIDEQVRSQLEQTIRQEWGGSAPSAEWRINVIEGKPLNKLLHWLEVKKADLLLIGQKQKSSGSGITARKLANQAGCSVLFVPEQPSRKGHHLLTPVDFSSDSAKALRLALDWRLKAPEGQTRITALHITDLIAAGYYLNRQEFENFNQFLTDTARKSFETFLTDYEIPREPIEEVLMRNDEGSISERILEYAAQHEVDYILMGAQGHGAVERFFFGSVTEKLVSQPLPLPVLVVR